MRMERSSLLQRGVINLETGEFPLTLFTNGEASDGHIVDIKGLDVADHIPMFANHNADPTRQLGGLTQPHKAGKVTQLGKASLKQVGRLDPEGDGEMPDVRRDLIRMIHNGDITQMSGRWDSIESVPRAALDKNHYAYSEIESGWETPTFFKKSRALEGSIVGVGADQMALVGRSHDSNAPVHVRAFYDVLVNGDPLSRDRAMESLYVSASKIEGWDEIACEDGKIFVPAEVARVWGQSIEDAHAELANDLAISVRDISEEYKELTDSEPLRTEPESETPEETEPLRTEPSLPQTSEPAVGNDDMRMDRGRIREELTEFMRKELGYVK